MVAMTITRVIGAGLAVFLALAFATPVLAGDGPGYDLSSLTVDCGGAVVEAGGYRLGGTAGQPDAGVLAGDGYRLVGGFWGGVVLMYPVYLPLVLRGS
jgi:hypothetical protein